MQMSCNYGQPSFKALLYNYGKCHKTHSMTTRYKDQTVMYDDAEEMPAPMTLFPWTLHQPLIAYLT